MCGGRLFSGILFYSVPIIISSVLQLFFNAADTIIVGRWSGKTALAAVGSTGSLINLIINLFIGLSIGVNVAVAQHLGAKRYKEASEAVHTSIALGVISGVIVAAAGMVFAPGLLRLMGTPEDVIGEAILYTRIYFFGAPFLMIYNFGAAVLRADGDTKRPLYFLTAAGAVNVILNLIFVIVFKMGVAGVALATVISQFISCVLVINCLTRLEDQCRFTPKYMKIYGKNLSNIVKIGLPAGIQNCVFSLSNMLIQSGINSFGSSVMAGDAAASNLLGFVYVSMISVAQAALTFTGQNVGAKNYRRTGKICAVSSLISAVVGIITGGTILLFAEPLLRIYTSDASAVEAGKIRLLVIGLTYFLCGIMECICSGIRGYGKSFVPMAVSMIGVCGMRMIWIYTVFASYHTLFVLYSSYPISWILTTSAHLICFIVICKRHLRLGGAEKERTAETVG
ncbi:MAG: MATE family efflux transporter [Clostridiales bacterium]|nr:MATE family efflux transporter [Clostridiales bacterium]